MKRSKLLVHVLVVMLLVSMSGASAFADVVAPVVDESAVGEETVPAEEPDLEEEPVVEPEVSYLRFDVGSDLVFVAEDGVIVSVTTELDLTPEEPVADPEEPVADPEEPVADPEEPVADLEEPVADLEEPVADPGEPVIDPETPADPYAEYLGLSVAEGIDKLLAGNEFEGPIELDIFANGETANELRTMLEEGYAEQLTLKTVALDSTNPNADRFIQAAVYRITPGKMNLIEKLGGLYDEAEIDYASWSLLSVKEIQSMTKENHGSVQSAGKEKAKPNNGSSKAKNKK